MNTELIILVISALVVIGVLIYNSTKEKGIPGFLIFMGIGLVLGDGTWGEPLFDKPKLTETLSSIALNIIIFVGGFQTPMAKIRSSLREGGMLATVGVLLTTFFLGVFTMWVTDLPWITALLFGALVSSTDAAVVFGIIEAKKISLKHNTGSILEFESATNDPMALILVTIFTGAALAGDSFQFNFLETAASFGQLLVIGAIVGVVFGKLSCLLITRVDFKDLGLIPLLILALFFLATYSSVLLGGNLLISSYLFGVIVGNEKFKGKIESHHFNTSLSWLAQAMMFLFLGLQIDSRTLLDSAGLAVLPALFLMVVARPLAVLACYLPFPKEPWSKRIFISSIGLKGATPIVFAFIPLLAGVEKAPEIFNMVFVVVLASVVLQGMLLSPLAKKLDLNEE